MPPTPVTTCLASKVFLLMAAQDYSELLLRGAAVFQSLQEQDELLGLKASVATPISSPPTWRLCLSLLLLP